MYFKNSYYAKQTFLVNKSQWMKFLQERAANCPQRPMDSSGKAHLSLLASPWIKGRNEAPACDQGGVRGDKKFCLIYL